MAFQGTPVVQQISDRIVRIAEVYLAASGSGVIAQPLASQGGIVVPFVRLPEGWMPEAYSDADRVVVAVPNLVKAWWVPMNGIAGAGNPAALPTVTVEKTLASNGAFVVEFVNLDTENATPGMEIYLETH